MRKFDDGKVIYDFGQNVVGWIAIEIPAKKDQTITIRMAEMLKEDGTLYRGNYRTARSLANFIPAKDGIADYTQTFTFFGFQYVEITGYDPSAEPSLEWVSAKVLHTNSRATSSGASAATSSTSRPTAPNATNATAGPATPRSSRRSRFSTTIPMPSG
jgi:alpha-L-rhamnosidase